MMPTGFFYEAAFYRLPVMKLSAELNFFLSGIAFCHRFSHDFYHIVVRIELEDSFGFNLLIYRHGV